MTVIVPVPWLMVPDTPARMKDEIVFAGLRIVVKLLLLSAAIVLPNMFLKPEIFTVYDVLYASPLYGMV